MGRLLNYWNMVRKYKYPGAIILFLLLVGFLDENSLYTRYQRQVVIGNLKHEIDKYQAEYDAETAQLDALENDPEAVERMARERYYMKRPNEDVFVFLETTGEAD